MGLHPPPDVGIVPGGHFISKGTHTPFLRNVPTGHLMEGMGLQTNVPSSCF